MPETQVEPSFRSMDAVRVIATVSIILLHAVTPYVTLNLPTLLWPVEEPANSTTVDAVFWIIRCFARGTLFLVAGYASAAVLARRGPQAFLKRRAGRIAIPLLAGTVTVLPIMYFVWASGWIVSGLAVPKNIWHIRFKHGIQGELYGFAHLWFLWYLLIVSVVYATFVRLFPKVRISEAFAAVLSQRPWRWLVVGLPVFAVIALAPKAIFDFRNGFIPRIDYLAYHVPFFISGVIMHRAKATLSSAKWWWLECVLAIPVALVLLELLPTSRELANPHWLAAAVAAFGALVSAGLMAWSFSPARASSPAWAFWSERSFFLYFWHLPFVGLVHVLMFESVVPVALKCVVAFVLGIVGPVMLYGWLKGRRIMRLFGEDSAPSATKP